MDRLRARELLPIIEAFANGEEIEVKYHGSSIWRSEQPMWTDETDYRIKPKAREFWVCISHDGQRQLTAISCEDTTEDCIDHYQERIRVKEVL